MKLYYVTKELQVKRQSRGTQKHSSSKLDLQTLKKSPHGQSLKFQQKKHPNFLGIYIQVFYIIFIRI